jgi:hypothetical protein
MLEQNSNVNPRASREPRPGRAFECLVEEIQRWLLPRGAEIKSPDFLVDRDTGRKREVDVSIRIPTAKGPFLTVLECRDRSRSPDVAWIEQIAKKCESVRANRVVAVSSHAFGDTVRLKAHALQVEVRHVEEIDEDIATRWGRTLAITSTWPHYQILDYRFITDPELPLWKPDAKTADRFAREPFSTAVGFHRETEKPITLSTLASSAINAYPLLQAGKDQPAEPQRYRIELGLAPGRYLLKHAGGQVNLIAVKMVFDLWWAVPKPVSTRCWAYRDPSGAVTEYARFTFRLPNGEYLCISCPRDTPTWAANLRDESAQNSAGGPDGGAAAPEQCSPIPGPPPTA